MGLLDDLLGFLGVTSRSPAQAKTIDAVERLMHERRQFTGVNVVDELRVAGLTPDQAASAPAWLEAMFHEGALEAHSYTRTLSRSGDRVIWIYHREGTSVADEAGDYDAANAPVVSPAGAGAGVGGAAVSGASASATPAAPSAPHNPFDAGALMKLSASELRARAMKIQPYQTAWIGRVDVIPPQSDERTALVDRGLVLRGLMTEDEIAEAHRVGDLWLEHRHQATLARAQSHAHVNAALAALDKERAETRQEKRRLAKERRAARAEAIAKRRATDIVFLGRGVSGQLGDRRADVEKLERAGLPALATPADIAKALDLTVPRLRWLAFHAEATDRSHYVQFEVPKRSGGTRRLSAPKPELARAQRWVLESILDKLPVEDCAHGFVRGRSTRTNAEPHVGQHIVVNLDLSDFFGTITFVRVRGLLTSLGYSPAAATVLALLVTEAPRREVRYAAKPYQVAIGPRSLPQGACTSPALSNAIAYRLDRRLSGLSKKHGWTFTRYADDLTFSAGPGANLGLLMARVRSIVVDEGFVVNESKGRVQRRGGQQTVTGIVVNEAPHLPRKHVRRLRAIVHQVAKTGLEAQNREGHPDFEAWLRGHLAYLSMVDPDRGQRLLTALDAALA